MSLAFETSTEAPFFTFGRGPTKKERLAKEKKEKEQMRKKKFKASCVKEKGKEKFSVHENIFKQQRFHILPDRIFHPRIAAHLWMIPSGFVNKFKLLSDLDLITPTGSGLCAFWSKELVKEIKAAVQKTMKSKFLFRQLVHHWRYNRLPQKNEEDFFSLEKPVRPVFVVDWNGRQKWCFEGQSMMRDITSRLTHNDGFFEEPQAPRNPYTNLPLTRSQLISLWNQLSASASASASTSTFTPSFAFTAFRQSRWVLKRFKEEHSVALRLAALQKTMKDVNHADTFDAILSFAREAFENEDVQFFYQVFCHALKRHPDHLIVQKWRGLCQKYNEAEIRYKDSPDILHSVQDKLWDSTIPLIALQKELVALRNEDIRLGFNAITVPSNFIQTTPQSALFVTQEEVAQFLATLQLLH